MGDYTAFEIEDGACFEQVKVICKHLTDAGAFGGQANLNEGAVDTFITSTYWQIVIMLAQYKWSYNQTESSVVQFLQFYNALGASAKIELSVATAGFAPKENNRFGFLWQQFHDGLVEALSSNALGMLGALPLDDPRGFGLTAGGISLADKDTIGLDLDNVYSFRRKLMDNPFSAAPPTDIINKELP